MENLETKTPDTFQDELKHFKMLILGSKMAQASSILLICFSFLLMFYSQKDMMIIISLLIGALALAIYIFKFLPLGDIALKSYNQKSLNSSISKLKVYSSIRKKREMYFISIWAVSLVPFISSYLGSDLKAIIAVFLFIAMTGGLGFLAFMKTTKDLNNIGKKMQIKQ